MIPPLPLPREPLSDWALEIVSLLELVLSDLERATASSFVPIPAEDESGTPYTLNVSDANKVKRFSAASPAVTIPTATFRENTEIGIRQTGTGALVLTTTGWTVNGTLPTWAQHVECKLRIVDSTTLEVIY